MSAPAADPPLAQAHADHTDETTSRILLRWLVGLRWAVFGLLVLTLPVSERLFGVHVRYAVALPALVLVAAVNLGTWWRIRQGRPISIPSVSFGVAFDLLAVGVVLACAGGASNPFSALFLVHVALSASLLPARTTFALAGLAVCVFAALFAVPSGSCCPSHPAHGAFSAHLYGMWLAFVLCAGLVAYFVTRVRAALDERGREIARLRRRAEEGARFEALGTLAAGTAHELATPLGTIAVLGGEIADMAPASDSAREYARAILMQVERCRRVIMKMQAGSLPPQRPGAAVAVAPAVLRAVETWRAAHPEVVVAVRAPSGRGVALPLSAGEIETILCALLDNALHAAEAARATEPLVVEVSREGTQLVLAVEDAGAGVPEALRDRLGEPFLTTKEPGEGMGLGLYLVRRAVEPAGGRMSVIPRHPHGTRVVIAFEEHEAFEPSMMQPAEATA
jgi:two-component system sensor histidine kinase RegB